MNSKAIIAIAVAAVVVAVGAGIAIYVLSNKDDGHDSDYSLLTSVKTDGAKGSLYYIYETETKGLDQKTTVITAVETTADDIHVTRELSTKYSDYTVDLSEVSAMEFITQFFDFTSADAPPSGITVTKTDLGMSMKYAIAGEGKVGEQGAQKTLKFSDDFYIAIGATSEVTDAKGTATVDGRYIYGFDTVDYDSVKWSFSDGKAVLNGKYTAEMNSGHYASTEAFVNDVFRTFDTTLYASVITETKDVSYKGVDCKEYTLSGTFMGKQIEGKVHALGGYLIDSEGKLAGESSSVKVQIYYL